MAVLFDPEVSAAAIAGAFSPRRVLIAGPNGHGLAAALSRLGVEPVEIPSLADLPAGGFDLVVCLAGAPVEWLRRFAEAELVPDFSFDAGFLGPDALLLRRTQCLASELQQLRQQLQAVNSALAAVLERQDPALERLDRRITASAARIEDILNSRIWRTLAGGGAVLLRASAYLRSLARPIKRHWVTWRARRIRLQLDEAGQPFDRPDVLRIRGWALSASGIERVEIQLDDEPARPAHIGFTRPDVARAFPLVPGAAQAGFELEIPSGQPERPQRVRVRAISRTGAVRVIEGTTGVRRRSTVYDRWIDAAESRDDALVRLALQNLPSRPVFSILVPVYRPDPALLEETIASVRRQSYPHWELCLADDDSGSSEVLAVLERAAADARIRVVRLEKHGGIAAATNAALRAARGDYAGFLDHDDLLAPDALYYIAEAIHHHPAADVLYSDEDKIDAAGHRYDPFFKPQWSPDLLLSENYVCHFLVARRALIEAAGGLRSDYDGAQDYDLILRLAERASAFVHVPKVLYHWRASAGSMALNGTAKPRAGDAAARAVRDHLGRRGLDASVEPGCGPGRLRVRYRIPAAARVSILIPSGGNVATLRTCLRSLARTTYSDYEVLVVDNSRGRRIERLVRHWERPVRYLDWRNEPFNYSALNNAGARECSSPLLLFLNDDVEVLAPDWLEAMVELGARPEVGAVGAKLLYFDGRIQHAGVVLGLFETCGHAFRGLDGGIRHYFDFPDVVRNVSAVTGACMLVRSSVFWQAGGFDEGRFPVAFNDVDLCLRLGRLGYRVLYTPHAVLYHWESRTRDISNPAHERWAAGVHSFWTKEIAADPFYSPHLTRTAEDYSIRS